MKRRRIMTGLEEAGPEEEGRRVRMTRKAAGEEEGWMNWKVSLSFLSALRIRSGNDTGFS